MGGRASTQAEEELRYAWVDVAKGICIVLVVMMHSTVGTGEALGGEGFLHPVVAFAQPFRIPDFFLLSGLFVGRAIDRDWRRFTDRRIVHFAYFYLLWLLLQSAVKYETIVGDGGVPAFLAHLAFALVEPYSTLWFIYLLAVFSVVTKLLRSLPGPVLLGAAALLQIVPVPTSSYLIEEFCARYVYFVGGYLLADQVFAFSDAVRRHRWLALASLGGWALVEGWPAFTPSGKPEFPTLAALPVVSLALGFAGALAIVALATLLDVAGGVVAGALRTCGKRSIAIYLAFFLPMAASRSLLVKTGVVTDIGLASLIVTTFAVALPLIFAWLIRGTRLDFLFRRPLALHLPGTQRSNEAVLRTA